MMIENLIMFIILMGLYVAQKKLKITVFSSMIIMLCMIFIVNDLNSLYECQEVLGQTICNMNEPDFMTLMLIFFEAIIILMTSLDIFSEYKRFKDEW